MDDEEEHDSGAGSDGRLAFDLIDFDHSLRHLAAILGRLSSCVGAVDRHRKAEFDFLSTEADGLFERAWALWEGVIAPKLRRRMLPDTGRPPWPL